MPVTQQNIKDLFGCSATQFNVTKINEHLDMFTVINPVSFDEVRSLTFTKIAEAGLQPLILKEEVIDGLTELLQDSQLEKEVKLNIVNNLLSITNSNYWMSLKNASGAVNFTAEMEDMAAEEWNYSVLIHSTDGVMGVTPSLFFDTDSNKLAKLVYQVIEQEHEQSPKYAKNVYQLFLIKTIATHFALKKPVTKEIIELLNQTTDFKAPNAEPVKLLHNTFMKTWLFIKTCALFQEPYFELKDQLDLIYFAEDLFYESAASNLLDYIPPSVLENKKINKAMARAVVERADSYFRGILSSNGDFSTLVNSLSDKKLGSFLQTNGVGADSQKTFQVYKNKSASKSEILKLCEVAKQSRFWSVSFILSLFSHFEQAKPAICEFHEKTKDPIISECLLKEKLIAALGLALTLKSSTFRSTAITVEKSKYFSQKNLDEELIYRALLSTPEQAPQWYQEVKTQLTEGNLQAQLIALPFVVASVLASDTSFESDKVYELVTTTVKGWYDLSKVIPVRLQWDLISLRTAQSTITADSFLSLANDISVKNGGFLNVPPAINSPQAEKTFNKFFVYSPFAPRGGFSFNTFKAICEAAGESYYCFNAPLTGMEQDPTSVIFDNEERAYRRQVCLFNIKQGALSLAYLFGADQKAAIDYVNAKREEHKLDSFAQALVKFSDFNFPLMNEEKLKAWKVLLLKYPKLMKFIQFNIDYASIELSDKSTEEEAISALIMHHYSGVPKNLMVHMHHALNNRWSQAVVDKLVNYCKTPKKTSYIPHVDYVVGSTRVRTLKENDPVALYVGELSGCCQHINSGAGERAAVQSFTEDWCSVLMLESESSSKLLAQSFMWTDLAKKIIVLDSIESVLSTSNKSVTEYVLPALIEWAHHMYELGFSVAMSDTSYGLTSVLRAELEKKELLNAGIPKCSPYKSLTYSDVYRNVYLFKKPAKTKKTQVS